MQQQYIRWVFSGEQYQGNAAAVVLCPADCDICDAGLLQIAISNGLPATAFVYPAPMVDSTPSYFIRWFSSDGEITLCGHGALAAADVILSSQPQTQNKLYLRYSQGLIAVEKIDTHQYRLAFNCIELLPVQLTSAVQSIFNPRVINIQQTEDEFGYLVVSLSDKAAVKSFDFEHQLYCGLTKRALIVTAQEDSIIYFRYFAPQYGVFEDGATGSAAPVLAAFWQLIPEQTYQCIQLSHSGGYYRLQMANGKVLLIGQVK